MDELRRLMTEYLIKEAGVSAPGIPTGEGPWWGSGPGTGVRGRILGGKCITDLTDEELRKLIIQILQEKEEIQETKKEKSKKSTKKSAMEKHAYLLPFLALASLGWSVPRIYRSLTGNPRNIKFLNLWSEGSPFGFLKARTAGINRIVEELRE